MPCIILCDSILSWHAFNHSSLSEEDIASFYDFGIGAFSVLIEKAESIHDTDDVLLTIPLLLVFLAGPWGEGSNHPGILIRFLLWND